MYIIDEPSLEDDDVGVMGLWRGSVYSAMSRFLDIRFISERKGQADAATPLRYSFVSVTSVLIVTAAPAELWHR
jgi:hypothetical protein